jgi:hypothetical protein
LRQGLYGKTRNVYIDVNDALDGAQLSVPTLVATSLVGFFAIFHGHAHGQKCQKARLDWRMDLASFVPQRCFTREVSVWV